MYSIRKLVSCTRLMRMSGFWDVMRGILSVRGLPKRDISAIVMVWSGGVVRMVFLSTLAG